MSKYAPELYERDICKYLRNNGFKDLIGADNNYYESVKQDIELFYPKVRKGGILGGCAVGHKMASQRAVLEFVDKHNLELHHISGNYDWWVIKQ